MNHQQVVRERSMMVNERRMAMLADPNVSRVHAEVRHEGLEYVLVDLGSTNGVEVNGRRVLRHNLRDGDRLSLGGAEVVVERR